MHMTLNVLYGHDKTLVFTLPFRYTAPEQYIMSTQTPSAPSAPVATALSPVLWQVCFHNLSVLKGLPVLVSRNFHYVSLLIVIVCLTDEPS